MTTEFIPCVAPELETPDFNRYTRVDKNGKRRAIMSPNQSMRLIHSRFQKTLLALPIDFTSAAGGLPDCSTHKNVKRHINNRYFYVFDISNAYPCTPIVKLAEILHHLSEEIDSLNNIKDFLQRFCADGDKGLAVGAPASPLLFNIYCAKTIDVAIRELLQSNTTYSRYVDDVVISSEKPIPRILRKRIRNIVEQAGFSINHQKSKVLDVSREAVTITGCVLYPSKTIAPKPEFIALAQELLSISTPSQQNRQKLQGYLGHLKIFFDPELHPYKPSMIVRKLRRDVEEVLKIHPKRKTWTGEKRRFSQRYIDEVLTRASLSDVVGRRVKLTKKGKEFSGLCPFHNEKTPSFTINEEKGFYHCFGCGKHGSVINFLMETTGKSFPEAVNHLAYEYGIQSHIDEA